MADPKLPTSSSKLSVEQRLFHLEASNRAKTQQLKKLEEKVQQLLEKGTARSAESIVIRSAVWDEFTTEFWQDALVRIDDDGNLPEEVQWTMPGDSDSILAAMCAKRDTFVVKDCDKDGQQQATKYYYLLFTKEKGCIPTEWAAYSAWKFALKVKYFLNLSVEQRLRCITQNAAYNMFKDSESLLYGRLKMLSAHIYEIHKLTWCRQQVNRDAKGTNVGPSTMSVDEMIQIQTPFMQKFLRGIAKQAQLHNRHLYTEHTAGSALASLLRNFKDTDRYVERKSHGVGLPDFGRGKKKVKITAPVPLPFEGVEEDSLLEEQKHPKGNRKRKQQGGDTTGTGEDDDGEQQSSSKSAKVQPTIQQKGGLKKRESAAKKKRNLKLMAISTLPKLKLNLRHPANSTAEFEEVDSTRVMHSKKGNMKHVQRKGDSSSMGKGEAEQEKEKGKKEEENGIHREKVDKKKGKGKKGKEKPEAEKGNKKNRPKGLKQNQRDKVEPVEKETRKTTAQNELKSSSGVSKTTATLNNTDKVTSSEVVKLASKPKCAEEVAQTEKDKSTSPSDLFSTSESESNSSISSLDDADNTVQRDSEKSPSPTTLANCFME